MRTRSRVVVPLALLTAVLAGSALVTGCTGDEEPTPPASAAGSSTPTAQESETPGTEAETEGDGSTDVPPFPADTSADSSEQSADARVTVRDIRIGRHDGFDRVVFEVGGTGTPGWDVRYVDEASSQGSGEPIDVAGEAVLQVTVTGAGYPDDTGVTEYSEPDPLSVADTEVVTEVAFDATFEGTTVAFVGTSATTPFRVYLLEDPVRIVVEVADPR
jgi:ABC-type phosphate transport system substrate-binding protein